ncbi:MAG: hypothetical protein LLF97_02470 [Planctomycetaceae bacterium]|nr:hypothetical protein [Planctomycetaceae bacterium]
MPASLERFRADLQRLVRQGERMLIDLSLRDASDVEPEIRGSFERNYQRWYTEARAAIGQLIPARADEFERLYLGEGRRHRSDAAAFGIQDWLTGRRAPFDPKTNRVAFNDLLAVSMRLKTQLEILQSAEARWESSLFELRALVRADLFDSELDACRELASHGFLRAAGTVAGVLLERHLLQVVAAHGLVVRKSEPTLNDFNDHLKKAGVLDVPAWRQIQRLADVRNLCGHSKHREPERQEVDELIDGVERVLQTLR